MSSYEDEEYSEGEGESEGEYSESEEEEDSESRTPERSGPLATSSPILGSNRGRKHAAINSERSYSESGSYAQGVIDPDDQEKRTRGLSKRDEGKLRSVHCI